MIAIETNHLFDGEASLGPRTLLVENGVVTDILPYTPPGLTTHHFAPDIILAPGFVDLQVNGGDGVLFNDAPTPDGLRRIATAHARLGTTSILPTLISGGQALRARATASVRAAMADGVAGVCGIHLEGPFIAAARRGIHPADALAPLTSADVAELTAAPPGRCLLTLAPDMVPACHIQALAEAGLVVFIGHTDADFTTARASFDTGAAGATHLFNAMSPFASRAPGVVGAVFDHPTACAGIIADGHHVHPAALRLAWRTLGPERLLLVSDAMPTVGGDAPGGFLLGETAITLSDGRLTDAAGTLAGAHLSMAEAVRFAVTRVGIPVADALRMATATPAARAGLSRRGRLAIGAYADMVALDADLRVTGVWQAGVPVD